MKKSIKFTSKAKCLLSIVPITIIGFFIFIFTSNKLAFSIVFFVWSLLLILHLIELIFITKQITLFKVGSDVKIMQLLLIFSFIPYVLYYIWFKHNHLLNQSNCNEVI